MKNIIKTTLAIIALSASALSYAASPQMVSQRSSIAAKNWGGLFRWLHHHWMTGGLTGYESR